MSIPKKTVMTIETDNISDYKRYWLRKSWGKSLKEKKKMAVIMHNPNVANFIKGDKSTNLCLNKAVDEECNELVILNLYSHRGNQSKKLPKEYKVYEEDNLNVIEDELANSDILVIGWGNNPGPMVSNIKFKNLLLKYKGKIKCFKINKTGEPCHVRNCGEETTLRDFNVKLYY